MLLACARQTAGLSLPLNVGSWRLSRCTKSERDDMASEEEGEEAEIGHDLVEPLGQQYLEVVADVAQDDFARHRRSEKVGHAAGIPHVRGLVDVDADADQLARCGASLGIDQQRSGQAIGMQSARQACAAEPNKSLAGWFISSDSRLLSAFSAFSASSFSAPPLSVSGLPRLAPGFVVS